MEIQISLSSLTDDQLLELSQCAISKLRERRNTPPYDLATGTAHFSTKETPTKKHKKVKPSSQPKKRINSVEWKPEEIEYLKDNFGKASIAAIAEKLGKDVKQAYYMKYKLGLGKKYKVNPLKATHPGYEP